MAIQWSDVTAIAPELSIATMPMQVAILDIVDREVHDEAWGASGDVGRVYLAAHLATISLRRGNGQITAEAVGQLSRQYAEGISLNPSFVLSPYGAEYERQTRMLPTVLGFVG